MANKTVKFNTKIINDNKVYLKVSDVAKALGYSKQQDFINEHPSLVEKISGVQCLRETDYNNLLSENETALQKQGQIEITKIETLRSKIDSVMSFQPLKMLLARDYLQMMAAKTGCKSSEEYIITHEIPAEKRKVLQELMQQKENNSSYKSMIEYLQDKERFDIDKIRSFGLDVQFLSSIKCDGRLNLDAYIAGKGVFCNVSDFGNYELWNDIYVDGNGDLILPWCNYDSSKPEEVLINLSRVDIEHDFSKYNAVENMIWCIENLNVEAMQDYETSVFSMYEDTIKFDMPLELFVKVIKPDTVSTIFSDRIIDVETGLYLTEFDSEKVFKEDYED